MKILPSSLTNSTTDVFRLENTTQRKIFIGHSKNLKMTYYAYRRALRNGVFFNKDLQTDWDRGDSFEFEKLESIEDNWVEDLENRFRDRFISEGYTLYNVDRQEKARQRRERSLDEDLARLKRRAGIG